MGQINPTVRLHVVTVDGSSVTAELRPPDSFEKRWVLNSTSVLLIRAFAYCLPYVPPSDYYITMVKWVTEKMLSVRWVNRAQNTSILSLCDVTTSECTKVSLWRSVRASASHSMIARGLMCSLSSWSCRNTWWHQRSGLIMWWVRHSVCVCVYLHYIL